MNEKNINFRAVTKNEFEVQPKPYPAVFNLPSWFKNAKPFESHVDFPDDKTMHVRNRIANTTFKKCIPLLDGMSTGYIVPLWADVEVTSIEENDISINWRTHNYVFEMHGGHSRNIVPPFGYHSQVFKYNNCWIPQTPKGYSCLIVSPLGHNDLIFKAIPAVVDTDKSTLELVFPVWVKKNFHGVVEKGTPIVQIIPFKRTNWQSTFDYYENGYYRGVVEERNFNSTLISHYLKNVWAKKKYK